jgi:hypothetical protein
MNNDMTENEYKEDPSYSVEGSDISWILIATQINTDSAEKYPLEILTQKMMQEAFQPGKFFKSLICGEEIEKYGILDDMEKAFTMMSQGVEEFQEGDFCIISSHDEGRLVFLPIILDMDEVEEVKESNA